MFNGPFSRTTQVSRHQKGKTNLDFTKARDSEWQWHQLGSVQVCTSLQADNHAITPPLSFLQAGCPSCRPANSVKALKATSKLANKSYKCAQWLAKAESEAQGLSFWLIVVLYVVMLNRCGHWGVYTCVRRCSLSGVELSWVVWKACWQ